MVAATTLSMVTVLVNSFAHIIYTELLAQFGSDISAVHFQALNGLLADFARITGEMLTGNDPTIRIKKVPSVPEGHA